MGKKMIVTADSRKRITLPAETGLNYGDLVEMKVLDNGSIQLTPVVVIPKAHIKPGVFAETNLPCKIIVE